MRSLLYSLALVAPVCLSASAAESAIAQSVTFKSDKGSVVETHFGTTPVKKVLQRADDVDNGIVKVAPEGKREIFNRKGEGWYVPFYKAERTTYDYYGMELVTTDDGTVYMRNPQSHLVSDSYLVGYQEGDKITFELPQPIHAGVSDWNGINYTYYCVMLDYVAQTATTGTYVQADDQVLTLVRTADGGWQQEGHADGSKLFGMVDHDGEWFGYGDWAVVFTPFNDEELVAPEGLATERWAMKYSGTGHFVEVGIDGNDMWVKGMYPACPDAWVKGTVSGNYVTFNGGQYLGMDNVDYLHNYFYGATRDLGVDPNTGKDAYVFRLADKMRFEYSAADKSMTTDLYIDMNAHPTAERSHDVYYAPKFDVQRGNVDVTPTKIDVLDFFSYDASEGVGGILFDYNQYNTKGQLLDSSKLYYRILVDEDYLEIDPADYQGVTEKMVEIPYWFTDYNDIFGRRVTHEFYFFVRDMDFIGIQPVYRDGDIESFGGITSCYGSMPDVWYDRLSGVESVDAPQIAEEVYTNIAGVRVANPEHGLFIRTVKYTDGTVKSFKVVK